MKMPKLRWSRLRRRLLALALTAGATYLALFYLAPLFFPIPTGLSAAPPAGLLFLDRNDRPIRQLLDGEYRADSPAEFHEFPVSLVRATLAAEDARFYRHQGIDLLGLLRAIRDAVSHRGFVSGASTITQQTVKLYSPPRKRNLRTKLIESLTARRLEMSVDKETILTAYLNHLPYGNQLTGARAAARAYFGKPLSDLSLAESTLLAGLPNKPSRLNPWRNLDGARKRQLWILTRMRDLQFISEAEFNAAFIEEPKLRNGPAQAFQAPHFTDLILKAEAETIALAQSRGEPLRTSLDLALQQFVEDTISTELTRLAHQAKEEDDLQAAVVVIENSTGEILALSGSRSFFSSRAGQINGAWQARSAGSTLKPFTYLLALQQGMTAASILADTPIEYITSTGAYQPVNFSRHFQGPVAIRHALANSLNVPTVKLLDAIGGPKRLHDCLSKDLHFTSLDASATDYGLGLTLGNAEVRLLELSNGYATLARLGQWMPISFFHGAKRVSSESKEGQNYPRVFDPDAAWLIADILSDEQARARAFGLHSPLNLPFRVAAKTGTSTDFRDSWTVGYTPDYTVGVWVGRFDNRPLNRVTGAMGAAPIFHQVMLHLHRAQEPRWYPTPSTAVEATVDRLNGKRLPSDLKLPSSRLRTEWFIRGHLPEIAQANDYDESGRTLLPLSYTNWWQENSNTLRDIASLEPLADDLPTPEFRIISPLEGTVAFIDPDLPASGSRFPLKIAGSGQEVIVWSSDSLTIEEKNGESWLLLEAGEHIVSARDQKSGRVTQSHLQVKPL